MQPDSPSTRVRIKICGITRAEDGLHAVQAGADALGLVFYDRSPRALDIDAAHAIADAMPPFVCKVGLFVDPEPAFVSAVLDNVAIDVLQFHGSEAPEFCRGFARTYIKAVRMEKNTDPLQAEHAYADASALLLDTFQEGTPGGTGRVFDWGRIPGGLRKPVILAGGLSADNVGAAIRSVRPFAVDVSGAVESTGGIKDPDKVSAFIGAVRAACAT